MCCGFQWVRQKEVKLVEQKHQWKPLIVQQKYIQHKVWKQWLNKVHVAICRCISPDRLAFSEPSQQSYSDRNPNCNKRWRCRQYSGTPLLRPPTKSNKSGLKTKGGLVLAQELTCMEIWREMCLKRWSSKRGGLSSGWSLIKVVSHQGGLSRWSLIRVVSHQGGFSRWSLISMVFHQGGL